MVKAGTHIGLRLRAVRKQKGLTLIELADITGISRQWLQKIENEKGDPSLSLFLSICEALAVDPGLILSKRYSPLIDQTRK